VERGGASWRRKTHRKTRTRTVMESGLRNGGSDGFGGPVPATNKDGDAARVPVAAPRRQRSPASAVWNIFVRNGAPASELWGGGTRDMGRLSPATWVTSSPEAAFGRTRACRISRPRALSRLAARVAGPGTAPGVPGPNGIAPCVERGLHMVARGADLPD